MTTPEKPCSTDDSTELRPISHSHAPSRRLIASLSDERISLFRLTKRGRFTIGRLATADWVLCDSTVSRLHAAVTVGDNVTIEDTRSLNGTAMGEKRLAPGERHVWGLGEIVRLGDVTVALVHDGRNAYGSHPNDSSGCSQPNRVVCDPAMVRIHDLARAVAAGTISVLLTGESGSGKEAFAELIHTHSPRAGKPFRSINCAALSETLLESKLFGHEAGAFAGATQSKAGLLESTDGGTLFLDEVGEMPLALQAKLLRVLEHRQVIRVGGLEPRPIDIRWVSATNRDLEREVQRGTFRRDFYYRINGATLAIPPLRERSSEVEPLARVFIERAAREMGEGDVPTIGPEALQRLLQYDWPGNIRELRNVVERAVLLCRDGVIREDDLAIVTKTPAQPAPMRLQPAAVAPSGSDDASGELSRIVEALSRCGGNQTKAAKLLGMARQKLIRRIAEYRLPRPKRTTVDTLVGASSQEPVSRNAT
jgi:DNA-binding NtrC family response regulator